jgi:hypothetical protein
MQYAYPLILMFSSEFVNMAHKNICMKQNGIWGRANFLSGQQI